MLASLDVEKENRNMASIELTTINFDSTVKGQGIVFVDFWAQWCGPCRSFAPVYEKASEQHQGVVFGKVDTEAQQEIGARFAITSIPTLMAFRDGILVFSQPGALRSAGLEKVIEGVRALDMEDVRRQVDEQKATKTN